MPSQARQNEPARSHRKVRVDKKSRTRWNKYRIEELERRVVLDGCGCGLGGVDLDHLVETVATTPIQCGSAEAPEDYGGGCSLRYYGADDRNLVTSTTSSPWNTIGTVVVTYTDRSTSQGTGALIGAQTVATAAHVLFEAGKTIQSIAFSPGQNGTNKPYGTYYATTYVWDAGFDRSANTDFADDFAMFKLDRNPNVGYLGIASRSDSFFSNTKLNTAGYPCDKASGIAYYLYTQYNTVAYADANNIYSYFESSNGQSGSPVILRACFGIAHLFSRWYDSVWLTDLWTEPYPWNASSIPVISRMSNGS